MRTNSLKISFIGLLIFVFFCSIFFLFRYIKASDTTTVYDNSYTTTSNVTTVPDTIKIVLPTANTFLHGKVNVIITTSESVIRTKLYLKSATSNTIHPALFYPARYPNNEWQYPIPSQDFPNGAYVLQAVGLVNSTTTSEIQSELIPIKIDNPPLPPETINKTTTDPNTTSSDSTTTNTTSSSSTDSTTSVTDSGFTSSTSSTTSSTSSRTSPTISTTDTPAPNTPETVTNNETNKITEPPTNFARSRKEVKAVKILPSEKKKVVTIDAIANIAVNSTGSPTNTQPTTETIQETERRTTAAIHFQGKAEPNSTIYLYIFSDPIIIAVTTDADGNWSYVLDRPLDTGKHEAYLLLEDGATKEVFRSEASSFFISTAEARSNLLDVENSKGLILEDPSAVALKQYGLITASILLVALVILTQIYLGKRKNLTGTGDNLGNAI